MSTRLNLPRIAPDLSLRGSDQPRIALIYKPSKLLTWREDLEDAFLDSGAACMTFSLRAATPAELLEKARNKNRLFSNEFTCRRIARQLEEFSPDLVIVLNYAGHTQQANSILRNALGDNVPIVGWLCDRIDIIPSNVEMFFDGIYYFDTTILPVLQSSGLANNTRLIYLPLAASRKRYGCENITLDGRKRRLVFAGNCTPPRKIFFEQYRAAGGKLTLYGPHSSLLPTRNRKLSSTCLGRIYRGNWLNLNLLQPRNTQRGLNLRAFEIPCAGGLGTYPDIPEVAQCFEPDKEIITFRSVPELVNKVANLLNEPERVLEMTLAGHRRVAQEHTFYHRAVTMMNDWLDTSLDIRTPAYINRGK